MYVVYGKESRQVKPPERLRRIKSLLACGVIFEGKEKSMRKFVFVYDEQSL